MTTEQTKIIRPDSIYDSFEFDPKLVQRGWDEVEVGYQYTDYPLRSVVVTEHMVDDFARMTGDFNPIHLDPTFARKSIHRQKIAHGALMLSLVVGQYHGSGFTYGTTLALLNIQSTFQRTCAMGEEVYGAFEVIEKEAEPHPKRGKMRLHSELRSVQTHEPFMVCEFEVLVRRMRGKSAWRRLGLEQPVESTNGKSEGANEPVVVVTQTGATETTPATTASD